MPRIVPVAAGDVFGSILPLSHLFELTCGMLYPLIAGATVVYMPSLKGPDIVRVMAEQRVSHMIVVPRVLASMGAAAEKRLQERLGQRRYAQVLALADRLPMPARRLLFWPIHQRLGGRLKIFASGGAALDPELQRFWERMGVRTLQGYGASECSPIIACGRPDGSTPYGSVGTPLPNVEIRIEAAGQLLARGPNVMRGYWEDPERTAKVITSDGFYATGDLVEVDTHGNIMILRPRSGVAGAALRHERLAHGRGRTASPLACGQGCGGDPGAHRAGEGPLACVSAAGRLARSCVAARYCRRRQRPPCHAPAGGDRFLVAGRRLSAHLDSENQARPAALAR